MTRALKHAAAAAVVVAAALILVPVALPDPAMRTVLIKDKCDPTTFNAAIGAGTCVGSGEVTFADFISQLTASQHAGGWRFAPGQLSLSPGTALVATNVGGETHTFTEVANFGPGFVQALNDLVFGPGATAIPEFRFPLPAATVSSFVRPGASTRPKVLSPGVHRFQCGIHPWMQTTVAVG